MKSAVSSCGRRTAGCRGFRCSVCNLGSALDSGLHVGCRRVHDEFDRHELSQNRSTIDDDRENGMSTARLQAHFLSGGNVMKRCL